MLEVRTKELKKELVEYATLVEKMIAESMTGLLERRRPLFAGSLTNWSRRRTISRSNSTSCARGP